MSDADFRRRFDDVPEHARRGAYDLPERGQAGADHWYVFFPGETVRCPGCRHGLTEFAPGHGCAVRIHPEQRRQPPQRGEKFGRLAPPTSFNGEAKTCSKCRKHLDLRFLPVTQLRASKDARLVQPGATS